MSCLLAEPGVCFLTSIPQSWIITAANEKRTKLLRVSAARPEFLVVGSSLDLVCPWSWRGPPPCLQVSRRFPTRSWVPVFSTGYHPGNHGPPHGISSRTISANAGRVPGISLTCTYGALFIQPAHLPATATAAGARVGGGELLGDALRTHSSSVETVPPEPDPLLLGPRERSKNGPFKCSIWVATQVQEASATPVTIATVTATPVQEDLRGQRHQPRCFTSSSR